MDRACQDIESELRKLTPEGDKINQAMLAKATIAANTLLRRKGISAYEMHTSRSQDTGSNLQLDDSQLHADQIKSRKSATNIKVPDIKVGDTVTSVSPQNKHKSREIYLVTESDTDKVTAQRLLHPLTNVPTKIMSRTYEAHPKHLRRLYRPPSPHLQDKTVTKPDLLHPKTEIVNKWSPINPSYLEDDSSDEEDEDNTIDFDDPDQPPDEEPEPITPPPSMEPSVLHILDPSSSDRTGSPPSSLLPMEPTSDQLAISQEESDESTDTVVHTDVLHTDNREELALDNSPFSVHTTI